MKIEESKNQMIAFEDFFGGTLIGVDNVKKAKNKKELAEIIEEHITHIEMMCNDAQSHLERFKAKLGLNLLP